MRHGIIALFLLLGTACTAPTRTQVTTPAAPASPEDVRPNNPAVPDAYAVISQFDRVLVLRIKYQADLLEGLQRVAKEQNIRNAVILAGIGSVRGYHVHTVSNGTFPSRNTFIKDPDAPADIVSMNGYILDGRVHAHITLADADKAFGGHLEPGTPVFTFAVVTVGVFREGVDLKRVDDKNYR